MNLNARVKVPKLDHNQKSNVAFGDNNLPEPSPRQELKTRIVSIGLGYPVSKPNPPVSSGVIRQSPRSELALDLQRQIELDKIPLPENRLPFVRKMDQTSYPGFTVGDQRDVVQKQKDKLDAQSNYSSLLHSDISKHKPQQTADADEEDRWSPYKDRKPFERHIDPEETKLYAQGYNIGRDEKSENEKKRSEAKERLAKLIEEAEERQAQRSPRGRMEKWKTDVVDKGLDVGRFEDEMKAKKKQGQKDYYAKLVEENGPPTPGRARDALDEIYINKYGWTGLPIGGISADASRSKQQLLKNSKLQAQEKYRNELKGQVDYSHQVAAEVAAAEEEQAATSTTLPLMSNIGSSDSSRPEYRKWLFKQQKEYRESLDHQQQHAALARKEQAMDDDKSFTDASVPYMNNARLYSGRH